LLGTGEARFGEGLRELRRRWGRRIGERESWLGPDDYGRKCLAKESGGSKDRKKEAKANDAEGREAHSEISQSWEENRSGRLLYHHSRTEQCDEKHFYSGQRYVSIKNNLQSREGADRRETETMANLSVSSAPVETTAAVGEQKSYAGPLAVVTTLFFMWGFLTCLNDILVPHLKSIFDLNYARVMLIQFAFFGAYFIFSIPSARIVDLIGYQRSMVLGLLTMGLGAFLFVPAASVPSYPLFLGALIVLAAGITCLQVAANPYVTVLGKPETASSRLNLTQAFNSLGTFLAPFFGGILILSAAPKAMNEIRAMTPDALQAYRLHEAATVKTPYVGLGIALVLLAIAIATFKLPKIEHAQRKVGEKVNDSIWRHPSLIFGAIAIFVYVGAEVSIGSFLVNYFSQPEIGGLTERVAAAAGRVCSVRRRTRGNFHVELRAPGDVDDYPGGLVQLHHVSKHLHAGSSGTGTADR
jgi:MFS family permease